MDGWATGLTTDPRDGPLAGRVALVTGAGRGLGRAIAVGLARSGANVGLMSRNVDELRATATEAAAFGVDTIVLPTDIREAGEVERAVASALEQFGAVDILVNAAGTSPYYKPAEHLEPAEWDEVIATNLRGTFLCCHSVGQHMLLRRHGRIVNISSVLATNTIARLAAYTASKAGVEGLTRALAVEWADRGVRVNTIAPAFIRTALTRALLGSEPHSARLLARTPVGRFGDLESVVAVVLLLASDEAAYMTGSTVVVDGGWRAS